MTSTKIVLEKVASVALLRDRYTLLEMSCKTSNDLAGLKRVTDLFLKYWYTSGKIHSP